MTSDAADATPPTLRKTTVLNTNKAATVRPSETENFTIATSRARRGPHPQLVEVKEPSPTMQQHDSVLDVGFNQFAHGNISVW